MIVTLQNRYVAGEILTPKDTYTCTYNCTYPYKPA